MTIKPKSNRPPSSMIEQRRAVQRKLQRQALKRMNLRHDAYKTRKQVIITA